MNRWPWAAALHLLFRGAWPSRMEDNPSSEGICPSPHELEQRQCGGGGLEHR